MLKKKIKYTNFNDQTVEEEFYFHLSKQELLEIQYGETETLSDILQKIILAENVGAVLALVKRLILSAYGVKSADGSRFDKSDEMRTNFSNHAAFQELYIQLVEGDGSALDEFVRGIMPAGFLAQVDAKRDEDKPAPNAQPRPITAGETSQ